MKQTPTVQNTKKGWVKPLLAIMVCASVFYASCRKTENSPAPSKTTQSTKVDYNSLSGKIATNLAHTLAGNFGGVNIMDGVDSVSLGGHLGPHHLSGSNLLCGFFTDSLVDISNTQGDTLSHTGGNLTFYFNCENGKPTGYTAYDSLNTTRTIPRGLYQNYYSKQYYTIKCLDDKHLFVGINGDVYMYDLVNETCNCTDIENANYVLKDLVVDICHRDILSGTATFEAYGIGWHVTGTVTFLGNHMADIDINGQVYHVNIAGQIF